MSTPPQPTVEPRECTHGSTAAPVATTKRKRVRNHYFLPGDLVWARPANLPYWPAEVIECDEPGNIVRARMLDPPPAAVLEPNLQAEQRRCSAPLIHNCPDVKSLPEDDPLRATRRRMMSTAASNRSSLLQHPEADVITAKGTAVYFFDRLGTAEEVESCVEERLQRRCHDVTAYEGAFYRAVLHANRLVRTVLSPERLVPYTVCGIGVVHSLMRTHISAPRQPHTGNFVPQTAVIRLRSGLENALRDLRGFDYIWILFQFSYAAAMATGEGQSFVELSKSQGNVSASPGLPAKLRQGATASTGYKTMIVPPRDSVQRGVFATRSPHRPNFIGLSCVQLVAVQGLDVHIADHDLLHGTPVLDIKPYLPFCDAHPEAMAGWVSELDASGKGKGDHKYDSQHVQVDRLFE